MKQDFDLIVMGGGPAGSAAASDSPLLAGQLSAKVEKQILRL